MKKIFSLFALLVLSGWLIAQEENKSDTTKINFGDTQVIIIDNDGDGEVSFSDTIVSFDDDDHESEDISSWGGIDMGINVWLNSDGGTSFEDEDVWLEQNYGRSFSWDLNLIEKKIKIVDEYVGIVTGLGLSYKSYGLRDSIVVMDRFTGTDGNTIDSTYYVSTGEDISFSKNKFRTSSLKVPVLLQINTNKDVDRNFHIAAGVLGGWNFRTMVKQVYEDENKTIRNKSKGSYNVSDFTLDAHVRIGYKNFTLFATYGLSPFFEEGKGPDITTATVGLQIVPF